MTAKIKTVDLKPGMKVARDVKNLHDNLLVSAGVKLSLIHLKVFKIWGVSEVYISGNSEGVEMKDSSETVDYIRQMGIKKEMKVLFQRHDQRHPFIKELMQVCMQRESKQASD